jgi:uncharacterized membrane protein YbhN (UPF0104 family)
MSLMLAQLVCLALVVADLWARAWRIQLLVRGIGANLSLRDAFALNVIGDGASAVTPLRLGGEPARIGVMIASGVPVPAVLVASGYEVLITWPVLIGVAGLLGWAFGSAWWAEAGPRFLEAVVAWWPWLIGIVFVGILAWLGARRWKPLAGDERVRTLLRATVSQWREMPWGRVAFSIPPTVVSILTRTAILPVLVLTIPDPPAIGPVILGSFALLYSQLVLPTPAGVGAVEFGFLAGAAGTMGASLILVLALWRFYTTGIGLIAAGWLVVRLYGWDAVRRLLLDSHREIGNEHPGPDP